IQRVESELLTPMGVRTLSPREPGYQGKYAGNPLSRDCACYQGSVYAWLLGSMTSAYLRAHGRGEKSREKVASMVKGPIEYLMNEGMGQVCELFDGNPPHAGGGAIASARSVAELLRAWVEDVSDRAPLPKVHPSERPMPWTRPEEKIETER